VVGSYTGCYVKFVKEDKIMARMNYTEVYNNHGLFQAFTAQLIGAVLLKICFSYDNVAYKAIVKAEEVREVIDQVEILGKDFFSPRLPSGWWKISDTIDVCH
jgi:hypothetical protein